VPHQVKSTRKYYQHPARRVYGATESEDDAVRCVAASEPMESSVPVKPNKGSAKKQNLPTLIREQLIRTGQFGKWCADTQRWAVDLARKGVDDQMTADLMGLAYDRETDEFRESDDDLHRKMRRSGHAEFTISTFLEVIKGGLKPREALAVFQVDSYANKVLKKTEDDTGPTNITFDFIRNP